MNEQMLAVMKRRGELLEKIDSQRGEVAQVAARWRAPLALADQGVAALSFVRARPFLVASLVALLVWRRGGGVRVIKLSWRAWKGYRYLTALAARL